MINIEEFRSRLKPALIELASDMGITEFTNDKMSQFQDTFDVEKIMALAQEDNKLLANYMLFFVLKLLAEDPEVNDKKIDFQLANLYMEGKGTEKNVALARKHYQIAANHDDSDIPIAFDCETSVLSSHTRLGKRFETGQGQYVEEANLNLAAAYYLEAADIVPFAASRLAELCYQASEPLTSISDDAPAPASKCAAMCRPK